MSKVIELTYFGKVSDDGKLTIHDRKGFDKYLLQFAGKPVSIDVKHKKAKRSNQQNALFHNWINLLSEHTGYSFEETKEIVKYKFLKIEEVNDQTGEVFVYTKQTSKLNKSEFADFCTEMQQWCESVFGIKLPLPNENWEITFIK
jgi:hypothetical protein